MHLLQNISLKPYNTFGIDVPAEYYYELNNIDDLPEVSSLPQQKHILGGGSNLLLTKPVTGVVIHNRLKGIAVEKEDKNYVWVRVQGGEIWHEFVLYAINRGVGGIENLALIPGTVGAAPIQNIGAYGTEVMETVESVTFWYWNEKKLLTYSNRECDFGYRDSIFKHQLKHKALITSVVFKLSKHPDFNISYGAVGQELEDMGVKELSVKAIAYAVIHIRKSKLPDPGVVGNAGSFFKNPTIPKTLYLSLKSKYPKIPSYPVSESVIKVPAAWLIEQCGWKGYRAGETGVHGKQALVLVNYGNAKGNEIWKLSGDILKSVKERFGIELEREVQVW
jgi:UDP-N-acetylmuramate dehydrogenase